MKKRKYTKPSIETAAFISSALLVVSDNVGLITDGGSNAAKSEYADFEDDIEE